MYFAGSRLYSHTLTGSNTRATRSLATPPVGPATSFSRITHASPSGQKRRVSHYTVRYRPRAPARRADPLSSHPFSRPRTSCELGPLDPERPRRPAGVRAR